MIEKTLAAASGVLGRALTVVGQPFPGSDRTLVVRATDGTRTVVVKRYLDQDAESRHREPAGLLAMAGSGTPRVLAEDEDVPLVVMTDLGSGPHLASRLLGRDRAAGEEGLLDWADALGALHRVGRERTADFEAEVARRDPTVVVDFLPEHLDESAGEWPQLAARFHVEPGPFEVLREIPHRWRAEVRSVSPNDTCPDNCIETPAGTALLDLEHATVRHVAMDAAYLVAPWPTCWCAWGIPAGLAERALQRWAQAAHLDLTDDLRHDIDLAATAWHWMTVGWFAPGLFAEPAAPRPGKPTPERQDRLVRSLRAASRSETVPELAPTAAALADAVERGWPVGPVLDAPAFR